MDIDRQIDNEHASWSSYQFLPGNLLPLEDRQINRQIDRDREIDKYIDRQINKERASQSYYSFLQGPFTSRKIEIDGKIDKQIDRQMNILLYGQTDGYM